MRSHPVMSLAAALVLCASPGAAGEWPASVTPAASARARPPSPPPSARGGGAERFATPIAARAPQASPTAPPPGQLKAQVDYLVRTTLLTLSDANRTGNYTVLRDIASPTFRERNSAADLALIFADVRRAKLDLSLAALMAPELDEPPKLDADRRLHLKGSYPTQPNRVAFEISYEAVGGHWRLHGVSISTRPARQASADGHRSGGR